MTVTKLALHPREHAETVDIVGDRVHEEGALRPRLVPLRVHEGGVDTPVQELCPSLTSITSVCHLSGLKHKITKIKNSREIIWYSCRALPEIIVTR